jgi:hypothetical protein
MNFKRILLLPIMLTFSNYAWSAECRAPTLELPSGEWRQISLPCAPPPVYGKQIITGDFFGASLPHADFNKTWVVYHYDATKGAYAKLGLGEPVKQGKGYWISQITGAPVTLSMPAGSAATVAETAGNCGPPQTKCYDINLEKGPEVKWNMIGTPFDGSGNPGPKSFPVEKVSISVGTALGGECNPFAGCNLEKTKTLNFVHNELFHWGSDAEGYKKLTVGNNGELKAWDGFWVAVLPGADKQTTKFRLQFSLPLAN